LGGNNTGLYHSLPTALSPPELKMFHFSSASGTFEVQQLLSQARTKQPCQAFPFVQRDLYELSQPALVLVDAGSTMWLWQGWWPDPESGEDSVGSGAIRWQAERRAAEHHARGRTGRCVRRDAGASRRRAAGGARAHRTP